MTNRDMIFIAVIAVFLVFIVSQMQHAPAVLVGAHSGPKLPINQYTNGVANGNTNDVATRVNFLQQPVGNNYS